MFRRRTSSLLAAAVVALAAAACADQPEPTNFGDPLQASASQAAADIFAVQARHTPRLMMRDGILGTGIRQIGARQSIVVYAVSPRHAAAARVPDRLDGYNVNVVVTGRIDAGTTTRERPAPSGFSVGHPDITAGTIGAIVTRDGNTYILSNNHVIANSNNANIGDPTLQPGPYDGGTLADQIGTLADFEIIVMGGAENRMDAAIALVNPDSVTGSTPAYGAPTATLVSAFVGQNVQKFGRTTGHTFGVVQEVNVTVSVCYVPRGFFACAEAATFTGQMSISDGNFSAGGDSGSLIVDSSKNPVGLLFAGSSTRTIANPIDEVMARFAVAIGKGDGSGGGEEPPPPPPPGDDTTAPSASFSVSCNNSGVCSFTDTSTDNVGVTAWSWNFGNGSTSTQQHPSTTYSSAGSYTVSLTVSDAAGNTDSASRTLSCMQRGPNLKCS